MKAGPPPSSTETQSAPATLQMPEPFRLKDCTLVAIATGRRAQNLKELRDQLLNIPQSSLFHHFWGGLLSPGFEEQTYVNDLAEWVFTSLHDQVLAERLAVIDPSMYPDPETMRTALVETVESHLDDLAELKWVPTDRQFHFLRAQMVVFDTQRHFQTPAELAAVLNDLSSGSVFYHLIDARQRNPDGVDDFRAWLGAFGQTSAALHEALAGLDPYFRTLQELRTLLAQQFQAHTS